MWGRLSSFSHGIQEFTREVIAPVDEEDSDEEEEKKEWSNDSDVIIQIMVLSNKKRTRVQSIHIQMNLLQIFKILV
jgi:predicted HAD superfamily phosphohydrolase YqeG